MSKQKKGTTPVLKTSNALQGWLATESQKTEGVAEVKPATQDTDRGETDKEKGNESVQEVGGGEASSSAIVTDTSNDQQVEPAQSVMQPEIPVEQPGTPVVAKRVRSKGERGGSQDTYSETFFKKPERTEMASKPIRVSEESHWLLAVLVEEARRRGHKLTVGDLIENLLANHRNVHKDAVDELLQQWKVRKKIA